MMTSRRLDNIKAQLAAGAPEGETWELQYERCGCGEYCSHGSYPYSIEGPFNVHTSDRSIREICELTEAAGQLMAEAPEIIRELLAEVERQRSRTRVAEHSLAREISEKRILLAELTDEDDCRFDHHGGCQAHGFLSLEPGESCPHQDAKVWLKSNPDVSDPKTND